MSSFSIAGRSIGSGVAPYIVAELSANHGGSLQRALETITQAKLCGADAIKLQTYTADTITLESDLPDFQVKGGLWDGRTLHDLYDEAHTPWDWHKALFDKGAELGITVFSTPFDETAVDLLMDLNAPAFKIASFELVHLPLIRRVAETKRPVVMSTGMASMDEIDEAVATFRDAGGKDVLLLHCVSGYPTPAAQSNLRRIPALAEHTGAPVGLSDHTLGTDVAVAAVALGACFIEKHFTLDRSDGGPDSSFSLEPEDLRQLVRGAATAFAAMGDGLPVRSEVETGSMVFRRSIYAVRDIAQGEAFSSENIRVIRPGFGLAPKYFDTLVGQRASVFISRGTALSLNLVAGS